MTGSTMQALQIVAPGDARIEDVAIPRPGPGQVLLKILAVTTCPHWDLHIFGGKPMFPGMDLQYPYTLGQPGHEACGDIEALGPGVESLAVGQRVCAWRDQGHDRPGCYAQYAVIDAANVIPVPTSLPPHACAPLELAMCMSAHVMLAEKLDAVAGKRAAVFGLGPAGLVCVQLLWAAGASHITGFDPLPARREMAIKLGADAVLEPTEDVFAKLPPRGHPDCFHCSFDCVGTPAVVHQAMELTWNLVVLFAVQREPYVFAPKFWPGLTLAGTQPHTREAAEYAVARIEEGRLDLGALVTDVMTLGEYARAVDLLRHQDAVKIAFVPHGY